MSKVPWHVFRSEHPRAHLVAASIEAAELVGSPDLKTAKTILERLVKALAPVGEYATSIVRETGEPEVHLAFANELDARKLADPVRAAMTDRYHGWASQRAVATRRGRRRRPGVRPAAGAPARHPGQRTLASIDVCPISDTSPPMRCSLLMVVLSGTLIGPPAESRSELAIGG